MSCRFFNNTFYTRAGGISTIEMNRLELDLFFNLDFMLKVNLETFGSYCSQFEFSADEFCESKLVRQSYIQQSGCPKM
jgi:hypothetical protein